MRWGLTCVALFEAKSFCVHSCNVQPIVHLWIMACWGREREYKELCDKCQTRMHLPPTPLAHRFLLWYRSFWKWLTPSCNISIPHAPWRASRDILILFTINITLSCQTGINITDTVFGLLISYQVFITALTYSFIIYLFIFYLFIYVFICLFIFI